MLVMGLVLGPSVMVIYIYHRYPKVSMYYRSAMLLFTRKVYF